MTHNYGPHRPEDAPTTVVIGTFRKWVGDEREVPIGAAVVEQRRQINEIAARATETPTQPMPARGAEESTR